MAYLYYEGAYLFSSWLIAMATYSSWLTRLKISTLSVYIAMRIMVSSPFLKDPLALAAHNYKRISIVQQT